MKIKTTEEFIKDAKKIHGDKYDYSLVEYKLAIKKVKIICMKHGIFEQTPMNHLKYGCTYCGNNILCTKDEFIIKSNKIHKYKYDYSLVNYKDARTKIKIICSIHGEFEQIPYNHLLGKGCYKCSGKKRTTKEFIEIAKKIHNNKYDYSLTEYKNSITKIKIICNIHNEFYQTPNSHLNGSGCPKCAISKSRIRRLEQISKDKFNGNQVVPSYNEKACQLFDNISKKENIHIKHAMNGGEYYIQELGYWLDGYDEINNVAYEYDEKHHFINNGLKGKDIIRQNEIEYILKCKFIRIKDITCR